MSFVIDAGENIVSDDLVVDRTDPFFFDHPLDHLPATLLLDEATRLGAALPGEIAGMSVDFSRFCELDQPIELVLSRPIAGAEQCDLRISSGGLSLADGHMLLRGLVPPPGVSVRPSPKPVDRTLVHRHHSENVAIGEFCGDAHGCTARMLDFEPEHTLRRRNPAQRSAIELMEAVRQLITLAGHSVWEVPPDWKYVLGSVRHEQQRLVAAGEDVLLRTTCMWRERRRVEFAADLVGEDGVVGSVRLTGVIVPPRTYRYLRWSKQDGK